MKLKLLLFMGVFSALSSALSARDKVLSFLPPPNTPPTIVLASGQNNTLRYCPGSAIANIEIVIDDSETLFKDLVVTFVSSNEDYIANSEIAAYPDPATFVTNGQRYLGITGNTIIPPVFVNGFTDITITVTDGGGLTATQIVTIFIEDLSIPTIVKTGAIASGAIDKTLSSGNCDYKVEDFTGNVNVSDDCTDTPEILVTQVATLNSVTYNIGQEIPGQDGDVVLVTLTAEDLVGKTATTTFTITLQDETKPVLTILDSEINEELLVDAADCKFTIKDYLSNVTLDEACTPGATITQSPAAGTVVDYFETNQEQTIKFNCTDQAGNIADEVSFTVKVKDNTNPVAKAKLDFVAELDAVTGIYTFTSDVLNDGSTDNCKIVSYTYSPTFVDCDNVGTTVSVTMTVTDLSVNTSTNTAETTVTVRDITAPVIAALLPIQQNTAQCQTSLGYDPTSSLVITDNCTYDPATLIGTRSDDNTKLVTDDYPIGTTTITWNVKDMDGNPALPVQQTVTMTDTEFPKFSDAESGVLPLSIKDQSFFGLSYDASNALGSTDVYPTNLLVKPTVVDLTDCAGNEVTTITFVPEYLHLGKNTVAWTSTDAYGNIATATQEVTIEDTTIPVITLKAPITKSLGSNGQVEITPADLDNGTTDQFNGNALKLTVVPSTFGCESVGKDVAVTFFAEDYKGGLVGTDVYGVMGDVSYKVYQQTTVRIEDTEKPTITTSPVVVNTNSGCTWNGTLALPTTADNCSVASVTSDKAAVFAYPVGVTTVNWTVTDAAGNIATATQTVTVNDVEKPIAKTINYSATLDATSGLVSITALNIDNGSSDNCGILSTTIDISSFDCSNVGANTVVLTVTDNNNNVSTANATVTVIDATAPSLVTKPFTTTLSSTGVVTVNATDVVDSSSDVCGIISTVVSPNIFTCSNLGANPVSVTVTDNNGNVTTETTVVTVEDNQIPTIAVTDIEVDTNSGCIWTGTLGLPVTADNCSVASVKSDKPADFAYPVGVPTVVTWTVTDAAGLTATATQTVTVNDVEKPIAKTNNFSVTLDAAGEATITPAQVDNGSFDNCGILSTTIDISSFDCDTVGENTVVLTVTDNNNNVSTANATITVVDATAPVLVTKAYTATLSSTGTVSIVASDVITTATDICGIKSRVVSPFEFTCANRGANTVTVTVTDNNNNVTTGIATVTVEDTTKPSITVTNITVDTNAGCIWTGTLGLPVTADNCSVVSVTSNRAADFAYPVGDTDVIWTVTDAAGNSNNATQKVTVRDTEKPIAKASDITIKLSSTVGAGSASITFADVNNGSSDNCGIKSVTINKSTFNCSNVGPNTVVITVTDNSDNVSTANAIVTVVDDTLPVINSVSPITVNNSTGICGANLAVTPSATATDNCSVPNPVVGTRSDAKALNAVYPIGRTIITWNVKDANGNAALPVIQTVDVTDDQIPVITSNGNKTPNADLGGCSAIVTVSATATDNCGVGSPVGVRSDAKPLAAAYLVGTTTITWNVTDVNGNAAVAVTQTVTVSDTQKPVITANGDKFVTSNSGCGATAIFVGASATATDNCTVGTPTGVRSDSKLLTADYPVGTTTITWSVTDANSNAAVAVIQKVVVRDAEIPVIAAPANRNVTTTAGECGWTPSGSDIPSATATDNCTVGTPTGKRSDNLALTAQYPIGTTTITWTVTDANANVAYPVTTAINVKDVTGPTVVVKNIELELYSGSVTIKPTDVLVSATDACGVNIMSYDLDKSTFTIADVSNSPITIFLTVKDIYGNTTVTPVLVTFPIQIVTTQALTPNGDGINDTWIVENITNHPNSVVRVFNRWGSLVYSAINYQNDWDGKLNGSDVTVPDGGSYYYQIDLKGTGNVDSEGWLYISRQ